MLEDKEKKLVYVAISVIIVLLIIVLLLIWVPAFSNTGKINGINSIVKYDEGSYIEKKKEEYKTIITKCVDKNNFEETYKILNQSYLEKMNISKEDLKSSLEASQILIEPLSSAVVYCSNVRTNGEEIIYTYIYKTGNIERKVHIIESYYDTYTVSFDQESYPIIDERILDLTDNVTGLNFLVKTKSVYDGNIVYDVTIINNTTEEFKFTTSEPDDSSVLYYENGTLYSANLNSIIVGSNTSEFISTPGSSINVTLSYGIALEKQELISHICFNGVIRNDGSAVDIRTELK